MPVGASPSIHVTRTTTQLLDALHDNANEPVWLQIDARYRPIVTAMARRLGLTDTDADEVAQQTLTEFVKAYGEDRYFNILTQARNYDPRGEYVRLWCPELKDVPVEKIHRPDLLTAGERQEFKVNGYPKALVRMEKWAV